jgi:hypothetical protein
MAVAPGMLGRLDCLPGFLDPARCEQALRDISGNPRSLPNLEIVLLNVRIDVAEGVGNLD